MVNFRKHDFQHPAHELLQADFEHVALEIEQGIRRLDGNADRRARVLQAFHVHAHAEAENVLFVGFHLGLSRLDGNVHRLHVDVSAFANADNLFRPDVLHQLVEVVPIEARDDIQCLVCVLDIVGEATVHHIVIVNHGFDGGNVAALLAVVIQPDKGDFAIIAHIELFALLIENVRPWVVLFRFIQFNFAVLDLGIKPRLRFVPHLNPLDSLGILIESVNIPVNQIIALVSRFLGSYLDHAEAVRCLKVRLPVLTLEGIGIFKALDDAPRQDFVQLCDEILVLVEVIVKLVLQIRVIRADKSIIAG